MTKSDIGSADKKQRKAIKKACIKNAKWLLLQARDNFSRKNFNIASFLAITAYEESLKYALLNSHTSNVLSSEKYNEIASSHISKLLSKHAFIALYLDGKKLKQEYTLPITDMFKNEAVEIAEKRKKALYVDFKTSILNIPTNMNSADAMEEINRAYSSIVSVTALEQLLLLLKRRFKEIRKQKILKPTPISED